MFLNFINSSTIVKELFTNLGAKRAKILAIIAINIPVIS